MVQVCKPCFQYVSTHKYVEKKEKGGLHKQTNKQQKQLRQRRVFLLDILSAAVSQFWSRSYMTAVSRR